MPVFRALVWILLLSGAGGARAASPSLPPVAPVVACATLAKATLGADVGAPVEVDSATEGTIDGARYCAVRGHIARSIAFELRLPVTGWTQRFVQLGCGGLCGVLQVHLEHAEGCPAAREHAVALASTDMGHQGRYMGDGTFGTDPQARIDFGYRGVHLTALASKALIRAYYGRGAKYAYFSGCSDGGREALMEAQRFPADFDGIAAGAPAMNFQVQNSFYHAWMYVANHRADGSAILTAAKLPALHAAALKSCDALDGLRDGVIADPRACHFDPREAVCASGQPAGTGCLTADEADAARKLYEGPRDAAGHRFTIGGPQVGSELAWRGVFVPESATGQVMSEDAALGTLRYLAFERNPPASYSLRDFRFDTATFQALAAMHVVYDATDTDLARFQARGGKLLLWHGWSDPHISPINTIAYYQAVRDGLGASRADGAVRLFLFPGMYHCHGGDGFGDFDVLSPLMDWVESGTAPDRIVAHQSNGDLPPGPPPGAPPGAPMGAQPPPPGPAGSGNRPPAPARSRPIYAYPAVARYVGSGSADLASSFSAGPALVPEPKAYDWEGAKFMSPGFHRECSVKDGSVACP